MLVETNTDTREIIKHKPRSLYLIEYEAQCYVRRLERLACTIYKMASRKASTTSCPIRFSQSTSP